MTSSPVHRLPLCDVVSIGGENIDPRKCPTERFALFSIPAFDAGKKPEIISGCEIGSVKRIVRPGDCLFSKLNPRINRVWVVPAAESLRQIATPEFWPLRPKTNVKVLSQYLRFMLSWGPFREAIIGREEAATKSRSRLKPEQLLSKSIPVPPLPEQQRIVNLLDEADELRRRRQQAGRRTADLVPSLFYEMFGDPYTNPHRWPTGRLEEAVAVLYRYPTFYGTAYVQDGVPVAKISSILPNHELDHDLTHYDRVPREFSARFPRTVLEEGDLVMAVRGDTTGKIGRVPPTLKGINISPNLIRISPRTAVLKTEYLLWLLIIAANWVANRITDTAKKSITADNIGKLPIPLPPFAIQAEFAARVAEIRALEALQAESRSRLDDLFQSMLHRAFQGEL